ncbi:SDR family oxidoreductase [Phenylobacterium sp. LjRoot219]|uniref:SDR family oxidoreductase n=1 Tax=Phenylobacterium sp. LjRoot219 TaxID=3342283 RepID=UPI003ECDD385
MALEISTPPLNTPKPVADDVWIVDAPAIHRAGLTLPLRMTVIRLAGGELLLHSPTAFDAGLAAALDELGRVRHLIAPSFGHWMFLQAWRQAYPEAIVWAAPGLKRRRQVRASGVTIDQELSDTPPEAWAGQIEQVVVRAGPFAEVEFFHRASRTLVLTDLIVDVEPERLPARQRGRARLLGVAASRGKAPIYLRLLLHANRPQLLAPVARLLAFDPERVIFAHGRWFEADGGARLREALDWLLSRAESGEFAGRTVVVTGASSGIGRAAALAFARRGANLVLAARRADLLQDLAAECRALGADALAVPTDVTDCAAVEQLAQASEARFSRIDIWINNAGVGVFGRFHETDVALHRRTIEVNLLGAMHGAAAVTPRFVRQGFGTLINNISIGAWSPTPFAAAYTASKFGLRGFTASLRQELSDHRRIHVCGVFPAMIDTPGFAHGANTSGRSLDPGPLLYRPEDVAETFVSVARRPRAETPVGWPAAAGKIAYAVAPQLTERGINAAIRASLSQAKPAPPTSGAVLIPSAAGRAASGGWLQSKRLPSGRVLSAAVAGGLGVVAIGLTVIKLAQRRR